MRTNALRKYFAPLAATTAASLLLGAGTASAAVPDAPWSGTGMAVTTVAADGTGAAAPLFNYAVTGHNGAWTFSAVAKSARTQPVDWHYTGFHAWFDVTVAIEKFVIRDGKEIQKQSLASAGPVNCCAAPSGGFDYSGSTAFDLQAGDVYGFRMSGSNWDSDTRLNGSLALAIPDTTPPVITPRVTGQLGTNGFYTSDVHVVWDVTDLESAIAHRSGCDDASVVSDTRGQTFTCSADSTGGSAIKSVTIKRDVTAPALTVPGTILKQDAAPGGAAVDYAAGATDAIDPSPSLTCSAQSGTVFPIGATNVSCSATDAAGNIAGKGFDVLVLGRPPVPTSPKAMPALSFRYAMRKGLTRITGLKLGNLQPGDTLTLTCKGAKCPKRLNGKAFTQRAATTKIDVSPLLRRTWLKPGTVITLAVSDGSGSAGTRQLIIRKAKAPRVI
jgi:hypothetical protein